MTSAVSPGEPTVQYRRFAIAALLLAAPLAAQDAPKAPPAKVAGNWDVSFTSPQGAATWRVSLEQSADTIWGTANTGDFGTVNVTDGWVAGNDVAWTIGLNFQGTQIALNFTGTVKGDTISGQIDVPGVGIQPFAFTGVKVTGAQPGVASAAIERPRRVTALRP